MVTDTYSKMMSDVSIRSLLKDPEDLSILIREQRRQQEASDREKELSMYRSGSAPPTVEGSLNAMGTVFEASGQLGFGKNGGRSYMNEEQLLADPAYVNYYYSNVNLNPRLPPPLLSKEDWRFTQRLNGGPNVGGIGDRRKVSRGGDDGAKGNRSLFSAQPGFNGSEENILDGRKDAGEWGGDGLIGLPGLGLGGRQKSIAELIQDDMVHAMTLPRQPPPPASHNTFDDISESSEISRLHGLVTGDGMYSGNQALNTNQNSDASGAHTYASALGSPLSRNIGNDSQNQARNSSPGLPPIGGRRPLSMDKRSSVGQNSFNAASCDLDEAADIEYDLSEMNLSTNNGVDEENLPHSPKENFHDMHHFFNQPIDRNNAKKHHYSDPVSQPTSQSTKGFNLKTGRRSGFGDLDGSGVMVDEQLKLRKYANFSGNSYLSGSCTPNDIGRGNSLAWHRNMNGLKSSLQSHGLSGYAMDPSSPSSAAGQLGPSSFPPLFENAAAASAFRMNGMGSRLLKGDLLTAAAELQNVGRVVNHTTGSAHQVPLMNPLYLQYLRSSELGASQLGPLSDPRISEDFASNSAMDVLEHQKAYLGAMLSPQKPHFSFPYRDAASHMNHNFYGSQGFGLGMSYPGSPLSGNFVVNSPVGAGSPVRLSEQELNLLGMRNLAGGFTGAWNSETVGSLEQNFASSLLDEFKSNKTKCFELAEISGHVVEFSADQYGSRFIQQKLETATMDEKNMVFDEIMPHALTLMTDVFGNYVIQKFFEHGTASQIRELADQLTGHVLNLSLQMYGCRVIQKAIEVVDIGQKTKMVRELDGHVLRCVRDQNGNHVIQKCIECVPEEAIDFIVTPFYEQVVTMSTHPYGCRVIQRVLEHCHDQNTQKIMMDEIMQSVCMLAQDQYGNYVVQHVLEHGKPNERSSIIKELTGQIVKMSQQKFASNVIEKCLTFGTLDERKILVNEMLGTTDENEPLQAMMKDQFGNYVVQKVLETCDDQQLELILNRIKVHLNALKKYTYGKHIVARVEKLVAAGERRISVLTLNPAA